MTFYGPNIPQPSGLPLKALLAWKYFFDGDWQVTKTGDGVYIVTDESGDLEYAAIYPDEESFISWLELVASEHLKDDAAEFLRNFVTIPELLSHNVVEEMKKSLSAPPADSPTSQSDVADMDADTKYKEETAENDD